MKINQYADRVEAGRRLAEAARAFAEPEALVLALPRGGVPVAYEVAMALRMPLDIVLVRKLGVPGHDEVAMGAIASGGFRFLNNDYINALKITPEVVSNVIAREEKELQRREALYRGGRPTPHLCNRQVIIVDDGMATGATMRVAIEAVRERGAAEVCMAVPVAPAHSLEGFDQLVEHTICPLALENFQAVSLWYDKFPQTTDEEVIRLLRSGWREELGSAVESRQIRI